MSPAKIEGQAWAKCSRKEAVLLIIHRKGEGPREKPEASLTPLAHRHARCPFSKGGFTSNRTTGRPFGVHSNWLQNVCSAKTDLLNGLHSAFSFPYCQNVSVICGKQVWEFLDSDQSGESSPVFTLMKLKNIQMNYWMFPKTKHCTGFDLEPHVKLVSHRRGWVVLCSGIGQTLNPSGHWLHQL